MKSVRSPMARVRGLGSAKGGTDHWWMQRLTSVALIPLGIWFVASVIATAGADFAAMRAWIGSPVVAGLLIILIIATFYHTYLGLQVVVEDYVHHHGAKVATIIVLKGLAILLAVTGVLSVLTILFQG